MQEMPSALPPNRVEPGAARSNRDSPRALRNKLTASLRPLSASVVALRRRLVPVLPGDSLRVRNLPDEAAQQETHWHSNRGNHGELHDRRNGHGQHEDVKRDQDRLMNDIDSVHVGGQLPGRRSSPIEPFPEVVEKKQDDPHPEEG